ncbi:DUF4139 domain-containing protein [Sulfurovum riftiae]|uniref:DUF4139 domain-containing protein n=1 Tax=Sulfurovum riftiae TaxID=1630136 RepID=A0A151CEQ2_9BACT|nr:DUF4139 domain-containing protein [Sulfurovum riftiae]KYJ86010.1 hypothetical protein AS592_05340 [Sulfurovum riftiae]
MQLHRTLISLSLTGGLALASSLAVYQDSSLYTFSPKDTFIGFASNVNAKCKGRVTALEPKVDCPEDARLCKELSALKGTAQKLKATQANISVLNTFISLPQPTSLDADNWIEAAQRIGSEQARLSTEESLLKKEYLLQTQAFKKQAPSQQALYLQKVCSDDLLLELPYGQISFSTYYEAEVSKEEIEVTQYLSVTNRSGIDMEAEDAMFYYRQAHRYISPVHFSPWIVSKYVPRPTKRYMKKSAPRTMMMEEDAMELSGAVAAVNAPAPVAKYLSAREYQIENLLLPSTGEPVNVKVTSWKVPLKCELRAYPYRMNTAFTVCSFKPKTQIERNSWKIREGGRIVNDRAVGEYDEGTYRLYTEADPDMKIVRKPLVKRERTTGIFGSTVRKKDGYTLTLTNKSDKTKEMIVTERIPTSATEEIKVKLLSVKSEKKVDYKVSKEGKIEMHISLKAHEVKKIEVLFEISYDKELKINY